jgi:hypothetical protein
MSFYPKPPSARSADTSVPERKANRGDGAWALSLADLGVGLGSETTCQSVQSAAISSGKAVIQ